MFASPAMAHDTFQTKAEQSVDKQLIAGHSDSDISSQSSSSCIECCSVSPLFSETGITQDDEISTMSVLQVKNAIDYVVPSFSVLQAKLRPAVVTFGDSSDQVDVYLNADGEIPSKLPLKSARLR